ncbi:MAG TPA: hypothetical protein VFE45_10365 [Coriobacteriia bacterium]|nr:hypothetical protein [Coriobacteriia bacterium]
MLLAGNGVRLYRYAGGIAASTAPSFFVSRDGKGILLAVRDNAAPQFSVSRDTDGIMLGALR